MLFLCVLEDKTAMPFQILARDSSAWEVSITNRLVLCSVFLLRHPDYEKSYPGWLSLILPSTVPDVSYIAI